MKRKLSNNDVWTYTDDLITKNGQVYQLNHDEGRVTLDYAANKWVYEYDYRDHQGNLRLSFRDSLVAGKPPVVTQISEQDPTGFSLEGLNYSSQNKNNFGFLNRETIAETGWIDLNNRFYDPSINRFHQIDPIIKGQENYSLYQYGYNNPVMNTDPNGNCPSCPQGADAAKVYAVGALVTNKDGAWTWTGTEWTGTNPNASSTVQSNSPDRADRWSSGNFGQQVAYGFADGLYSMFANNHLGGKGFESYDDKMKTKLGGLMTLGGPLLSEAKVIQVAENLVDDVIISGKTQWGWIGTKVWKDLVKSVRSGGTLENLQGKIPTKSEAVKLIEEAGGRIERIESGHLPPNPHTYDHINYTTPSGNKGTIQIKNL